MKKFKRFDFSESPRRIKWYLKPIAKLLCSPAMKKYKPEIHYENGVENLKAPFLLLCNHNAFLDFKVAYTLLKKNYSNFIVAIDGFIGREGLLRNVGCICKRKFTRDIALIYQMKKALDMGDVVAVYPEARYSLCGTTAVLPESLGKMCKLFKVPVVTLMCHGHHVNSPFWDTSHERGIAHTEAEFKLLFKPEQLEKLSIDEINAAIVETFQYDDFKWQKDHKLEINDPKRADGLDKVLYQCPHCGTEYEMSSDGFTLKCNHCGKEWTMTPLGELKAKEGDTEFTHIPDWYEWQRANVRKEIEAGTYSSGELEVDVESLPNAKKFIPVGKGTLVHDMNGFKCVLADKELSDTNEMNIPAKDLYSVHVEYRYLFKHGDCIDLNTKDDTWYIYPHGKKFAVTKMALATEELFNHYKEVAGIKVKKGLA